MKRVDLDRGEIMRALAKEPNITAAARALGVARRTLQDRMRALGIPRGKAGRPTRKLSYRSRRGMGLGAAAALLAGGIWLGGKLTGGGSKA